jgi:Ca2+-transporting ATPase
MRTLGVAGRWLDEETLAEHAAQPDDRVEQELVFAGLIGMIDPPRAEAKEAVARARGAGIRPLMITGDHPRTAAVIAQELGITADGRVITGAELERLTPEAGADAAAAVSVYARVDPEHKLWIVDALQRAGAVVAMTGDGVNDAPALKKADIGIAMGITGTDVTKEAAEMTLTDDNFTSIVAAVEEGRAIFGNIKKYLMYLLAANVGEIGLMTGAMLFGWPMPLSAVQILYVNLATDGLPALALAVDPPDKDLMTQPPRNPRAGIFTRPVVMLMLLGGLWSTVTNLVVFGVALGTGQPLEHAVTLTFACLVLVEFAKAND